MLRYKRLELGTENSVKYNIKWLVCKSVYKTRSRFFRRIFLSYFRSILIFGSRPPSYNTIVMDTLYRNNGLQME